MAFQKQHITLFPGLFQEEENWTGERIQQGSKTNLRSVINQVPQVEEKNVFEEKSILKQRIVFSPLPKKSLFSRTDLSARV